MTTLRTTVVASSFVISISISVFILWFGLAWMVSSFRKWVSFSYCLICHVVPLRQVSFVFLAHRFV